MKKFLVFSLMLGAMVFVVPSAEGKSTASSINVPESAEQPNRWGRVTRTVTRTRITRVGRYRYRETYRTTYYRNGRTQTRVIRRVRLAGGGIRY
ncbi:MAG: hypothetical protein H7070_01370 [Saprospiraceae bacterium]|nr:hypothetical protein [Pyrinomonadaceae bacterium]